MHKNNFIIGTKLQKKYGPSMAHTKIRMKELTDGG